MPRRPPLTASPALLLALAAGCGLPGPELSISAVGPAVHCPDTADGAALELRGAGLGLQLTRALKGGAPEGPTVLFTHTADLHGRPVDPPTTRRLAPGDPRLQLIGDDRIEVSLGPGLGLGPGQHTVEVVTADGRRAAAPSPVVVLGPPQVDTLSPTSVCDGAAPVELRVAGADLLQASGAGLSATAGPLTLPVALEDCGALPDPAEGESCAAGVLSVIPAQLGQGGHTVTVTAADALACGASAPRALRVRPPPELHSVYPDAVCPSGGSIEIGGSDLDPGDTWTLGGAPLEDVHLGDDGLLRARVPAGALGLGWHTLSVSAPGGCEDTLVDAVELRPAPVAVAVDPPQLPAGVSARVVVTVAGVFGDIDNVLLLDEADAATAVDWSWDPAAPGQVELEVPGTLAEGAWRVQIWQGGDCPGTPAATLQVAAADQLLIDRVEPAQAWAWDHTPFELRLVEPLGDPADGLQAGAQAWLIDPTAARAPTRVLAPAVVTPTRLAGVVPWGLELGDYDLLVVNPDGSAGFLEAAITVVDDPPPQVDQLRPGTLANDRAATLRIGGRHFRDPSASLTCREGATETAVSGSVLSSSATAITLELDLSGFTQAVCTVEVVNADGSAGRAAAVSVTNPAQNLFPWQAGSPMTTPRRAPAAAAGRTTRVRRWLYAVGGDDGASAGAYDSVERAEVGVYGDLSPWQPLPRPLPGPRTLAAIAEVRGFLYLVGGHDGAAAVDTTWRAQILDPLDVPWFEPAQLEPASAGAGLGAGLWTWRVAALFPADDPSNPGGEGLATDLLPVTLPEDGGPWAVELRWSAVPGAVGYRLYRRPAVDGLPDPAVAPGAGERWIADVSDTAYVDAGDPADPATAPLQEGDLGEWAAVATLGTPRRSPCLVAAPDPFPDPERVYLYAAGGANASGQRLDSIEVLPITIESDRLQTVGAWSDAGQALSRARERCAGASVDSGSHSVVDDGEAWVYFLGGAAASGAVGTVDAAPVLERGALGPLRQARALSPARAGAAVASASDFLYLFGGQQDNPSASGTSGALEAPSLPDVRNWNSLGTSLSEARWLPGSAQESAVLFVIGGETDSSAASASVDWTNY